MKIKQICFFSAILLSCSLTACISDEEPSAQTTTTYESSSEDFFQENITSSVFAEADSIQENITTSNIDNSVSDEYVDSKYKSINEWEFTDGTYTIPTTMLKLGDEFLRWTLMDVSINNYGLFENIDTSVKASFAGNITVQGTINYTVDNEFFSDSLIFQPTDESLFPRTFNDTRGGIWCVIIEDENTRELLGIGNEPCELSCEIVISEFNIFYAPMETADTIRVLQINYANLSDSGV